MKTLYVNRAPVDGPWGGGNNFIKAVYKYAATFGYQIVDKIINDVDVILITDPRYDDVKKFSMNEAIRYKQAFPKTKVVYRVNECDKRKGETEIIDPLIRETSKNSDLTIFVSKWLQDLHEMSNIVYKKSAIIHNGVDKELFKKYNKLSEIDGKIHLVTHHWSNNPFKGHDVYKEIDKMIADEPNITFTYIGRSHDVLDHSKVIRPLHGEELAKCLSIHDIYISGSRFDPGPNHVLESLACELPTYVHKDGGGGVELAGADHSFDNVLDLFEMIKERKVTHNNVTVESWRSCMKLYFAELDRLHQD